MISNTHYLRVGKVKRVRHLHYNGITAAHSRQGEQFHLHHVSRKGWETFHHSLKVNKSWQHISDENTGLSSFRQN